MSHQASNKPIFSLNSINPNDPQSSIGGVSSIQQANTFVLCGVSLRKITEQYNSGKYENYIQPKIHSTHAIKSFSLINNYGSTVDDDIFSFRDRTNSQNVMATSNHQNYHFFTTKGEKMPVGGICDWCRGEFSAEATGVPVAVKSYNISSCDQTQPSLPEKGNPPRREVNKEITPPAVDTSSVIPVESDGAFTNNIYVVFWTEGTYCSFQCALAEIKHTLSVPSHKRDSLYTNSEQWLKCMYLLTNSKATDDRNPPSPIFPTPSFRLRRCFGGPLSDEEYYNGRTLWTRSPLVIQAPAKVPYYSSSTLSIR